MGPTSPIPINSNMIMSVMMLLIVFSGLSISNAMVLDTDGDLLQNGGKYLIHPVGIISINGGLTITSGSECPYYITRDKDETFPGIPVIISSPFKLPFINPGFPISIAFDKHIIDTCMQPLKWQVIADESTGRSYVRTGGSGWSPDFSIFKGSGRSYKIKYNNFNDGEVGFFEKDGLLGINTDTPLNVVFVKAGFNGIAMKL